MSSTKKLSAKFASIIQGVEATSLVFIDKQIEDIELLRRGLNADTEVHLLDGEAITQITSTLAQRKNVQAVHVVSHGSPGCLHLSNEAFDSEALEQSAEQVRTWSQHQSNEIYLYGCSVAAGEIGESFINRLEELTQSQVHASTQKVGSPQAGGDWQLNQRSSDPQSISLFSDQTKQQYSHAFAPRTLDKSFGIDGIVTTDFSGGDENAYGIGLDSNGRIVVVGRTESGTDNDDDFAIVRYHVNGNIDTSFGTGGKITLDFDTSFDSAQGIIFDPTGNLLVVGTAGVAGNPADTDFAIARFTSNGLLDATFGDNGKVQTDLFDGTGLAQNAKDAAYSITTDSSGNILVAGSSNVAGGPFKEDITVIRYDSEGNLDTTFGPTGAGGKVTVNINSDSLGGGNDAAWSITTDSQGRILVAGYAEKGSGDSRKDFALVRLLSNGTPDLDFGDEGKVTTDLNGVDDYAWSVSVADDGIITVGGYINGVNAAGDNFVIAKYTDSGALDTSFDGDGTDVTGFFDSNQYGQGLTTDNFNRLLVAGDNQGDLRIVRFAEALKPTDFDSDGRADLLWLNQELGALASWSLQSISTESESVRRSFMTADFMADYDLIGTADFNLDGKDDIFIRDNANDENRVLIMDGLAQTDSIVIGANRPVKNQAWRMKAVGNFDSDPEVEILWRNRETGGFALWNLDGNDATAAFFDISAIPTGASGLLSNLSWEVQASADINGDGREEIFWRNTANGGNAIWTLDENGSLISSVFTTQLGKLDWDMVDAADYDLDGVVDIAWRNNGTGQNVIWKMAFNDNNEYVRASAAFIPSLNSSWSGASQA